MRKYNAKKKREKQKLTQTYRIFKRFQTARGVWKTPVQCHPYSSKLYTSKNNLEKQKLEIWEGNLKSARRKKDPQITPDKKQCVPPSLRLPQGTQLKAQRVNSRTHCSNAKRTPNPALKQKTVH